MVGEWRALLQLFILDFPKYFTHLYVTGARRNQMEFKQKATLYLLLLNEIEIPLTILNEKKIMRSNWMEFDKITN